MYDLQVRCTCVYLDDQLWAVLHAVAEREKTTISDLVRRAVGERYVGSRERRVSAMQRFIGSRKPAEGEMTIVDEGRRLRKGCRIDRLAD